MKIEILKNTVINGTNVKAGDVIDISYLSRRDKAVLFATRKARQIVETAKVSPKTETATAAPKTETANAAPKTETANAAPKNASKKSGK